MYFTPEGPLVRQIPAFKARAQQTEMAERIADAITANSACLVEAGTGTGKTFAYLVPAMLSGGKVVLSTGTKTLQDQLFERDIPTVRAALGAPIRVALLKGRSNYVCLHHLERAHSECRFLQKEDARHITNILRFSRMIKRGDKAECADVPELLLRSGIWPHPPKITASVVNVPNTKNALSLRHGVKRWKPIWWWSITIFSLPSRLKKSDGRAVTQLQYRDL